MKTMIKGAVACGLFLLFSGFKNASPDSEVRVTIDGREIQPEGTLEFEKDDDVWLEATGLKPLSSVHFDLKKAGIKWMEYDYEVDSVGMVRGVVGIPDNRIAAQCEVTYYTASDLRKDLAFRIKVR